MTVTFTTLTGRPLAMDCTLDQFLAGPLMSHLAEIHNDCDPAELVRDYLPEDLCDADDDELAARVEEACLMATRYEPATGPDSVCFSEIDDIQVDRSDLRAIREAFVLPKILQFPTVGDPVFAA